MDKAMYIISNYLELYNPTNSRGEKLINAVFVKMPIKPRGKGLRALLRKPDGLAILGVWSLLLQAATETTKPELRGMLLSHKDEAANIEDIADSISLSGKEEFVKIAIDTLISMNWIEEVEGSWLVRIDNVPDTETLHNKLKIKESKDNLTKTKDKGLDFSSSRNFSFKKLFSDEWKPKTDWEKNTFNKYADKCQKKHGPLDQGQLPNLDTFIINEIMDIKEHVKTKHKTREDGIRMFIAKIKTEIGE